MRYYLQRIILPYLESMIYNDCYIRVWKHCICHAQQEDFLSWKTSKLSPTSTVPGQKHAGECERDERGPRGRLAQRVAGDEAERRERNEDASERAVRERHEPAAVEHRLR